MSEGSSNIAGVTAARSDLAEMIRTADGAIGQYATLRAGMFRELIALKMQTGGPWRIQYSRDSREGDPAIPAKLTYHTTKGDMILGGHILRGIGSITKPETFAPMKSFEMLDPENRRPDPESEAGVTELRMRFLLGAILAEAKTLAVALPTIQQEALRAKLTTDTVTLARLDLHLPVFPYWPRSPAEMTREDFARVLADERPMLDDARLTLRRLHLETAARGVDTKAESAPSNNPKTAPDGFYSPTDIAKAMNADDKANAIRMALKRMFDEGRLPDGAWMENNNPAKGQARILYKLSVVRPFLNRFEPAP